MAECRIMILEDEAIIAWDIEAELQARGFTVVGLAGRITEAMAMLERGATVALLDINVGGHNSYGVAQACRDRGIAVIFLSGDIGDDRPEALQDCEVVAKPVNYERLVEVLKALPAS